MSNEFRRRLEAGVFTVTEDRERDIAAADRRHHLAMALAEMVDPRAVLSVPQRVTVLAMLDEVINRRSPVGTPYLELAGIANYVHICHLFDGLASAQPAPVGSSENA